MTRDAADLLEETQASLNSIQNQLPARVSAEEVQRVAKVPFRMLMCRGVLGWRTSELIRGALAAVETENIAAAAVLARAAVETVAALWYLRRHVERALESRSVSELNQHAARVLHGSRTTHEAPRAIRVSEFVRVVEKDVEGFQREYKALCEFAHPNWAGAMYLFAQLDLEARTCTFGPGAEAVANTRSRVAAVLSGTALLAQAALEAVAEATPAVVALAERELTGAV